MKQLNKLFIFIIIANFLTATIGIPIYIHICEKSGTSFYSSCKDCNHKDEQEIDCCGNPVNTTHNNISISCCSDEVLISKADISLNFEQAFELNKLEFVEILPKSLYNNLEIFNYLEKESFNIPPPKFGKELIINKNEFKIDLLSC
ncbi:MAG TPA: hypothetical protein PL041_07220 [Melioribacteraceae bacterium]|nr:hypothetical protein [Melioribacteraceae bacterium]